MALKNMKYPKDSRGIQLVCIDMSNSLGGWNKHGGAGGAKVAEL